MINQRFCKNGLIKTALGVSCSCLILGISAADSNGNIGTSDRPKMGFEGSLEESTGSNSKLLQGWEFSDEEAGFIVEGVSFAGTQSLKIGLEEEAAGGRLSIDDIPKVGVRFIEVAVKVSLSTSDEPTAIFSLWGSEIYFLRHETGRVYLLLTDGKGMGKEFSVELINALEEESNSWMHLVVRQDIGQAQWDLFLGGELVAHSLPLGNLIGMLEVDVEAGEFVYLDELWIGQENPLFKDSDCDGMPDAYEVAHELNPYRNDRNDDRNRDQVRNIEEYRAVTNGRLADSTSKGGVIYVDNANGNDTNSGRTPHGRGKDGPKFSIKEAMAAAEDGATIVVMPGTGTYYEGSRNAQGKRLRIKTVQPIVIK